MSFSVSPLPAARGIDRIHGWFQNRGWQPADFQRRCWQAWLDGDSGLLHAPTGIGKTLAVWGGPLAEALDDPGSPGRLKLLWVTPIRALASDSLRALREPLEALGLGWRIERRTGDSSAAERARLRRGEAEVLVTTPESLALLLSYPDASERFSALRGVIVDEWHELLGTKRGVLLELNLERLRSLRPGLRVWGLSASLGNLDQAMQVLLGPGRHGRLIDAGAPPRVMIQTLLPEITQRFPWAGHLGLKQLPAVLSALLQGGNTLVFTNTRSQAELWYQALAAVWPLDPALLALHHGSLDRSLRDAVERGLAEGRLRCVVATSSLDLGVDFPAVDQVIQIGSPRGIARLVQRAGRSGHRPDGRPRILMVPTNTLELVEIAAARRALAGGRIEARRPLVGCVDVLAQHLVSTALAGGFRRAPLLAELRRSHAYSALQAEVFDEVLTVLCQGGRSLAQYPDYHRLVLGEDGVYRVERRRIAMLHRLSIGTITSDATLAVRWVHGGVIGQIEERFIARLRPGEVFVFAGRPLELVRIREMTVQVRAARQHRGAVPRWMGGRMPLSSELASELRALLGSGEHQAPELASAAATLALQQRLSVLPKADELLVERIHARDGQHVFVYPFAGRLVHEGLAALLAWRLARQAPNTYTMACNDYGLLLSARRLPALDAEVLRGLFDPRELDADLAHSLNLGELARRQFRDIARIVGWVFSGYPGRPKALRQLQVSSGLLYDVLERHEPQHLLLRQARREVLEAELDHARLSTTLEAMRAARLRYVEPTCLTPLSFPLWAERIRGQLGNEDWTARVRAMAERLEARLA